MSTLAAARATAAGLALGYLADQLLGDPRRWHPVAGFGRLATALERRTYADAVAPGAGHVAVLVGAVALAGVVVERVTAERPGLRVLAVAAATWTVLGGRSLRREASTIAAQLAADDLPAARVQVRNLVGRETARLPADEIARAALESVAENTSDAVVAPLLWGAVAGVPGLLGYRAVNTLDAMVGHRSPRYLRFGRVAARLDDVANWIPARVAGLAAAGCAPLVGGSPGTALRVVRRDAGQHPSPNAGVVEAAFAGALGVRLGGRNVYHGEGEERGVLGDGPAVRVSDLAQANRLAAATSVVSLALAITVAGPPRATTVTVLILGGTAEARALAAELVADGIAVRSSLAGRVSRPALPVGEVRVGGFGGAAGLADYLREHRIAAVVDATHPFAARISANAATAAERTRTPLVRLERPSWREHPGADRWTWVPDVAAARDAAGSCSRPFVTTGRQSLEVYLPWADREVLVRVVDPPTFTLPERWTVLRARGPYVEAGERSTMLGHGVDVLLTKDSGGPLTAAKLQVAADLGVPVVIVERPSRSAGVTTVRTVADTRAALIRAVDPSELH